MSPEFNLGLGIAFGALGLAAALLQFWLWTFPMESDPTGRDPNGRTTAPRSWRIVHRILGYGYGLLYLVLIGQMLPRWPYLLREPHENRIWAHVLAGLAIPVVLVGKVWILRCRPDFGKWLLKLGATLLALTLLTIGLVAPPSLRLAMLPASTPEGQSGKAVLRSECLGCHGATPILKGSREDRWPKVLQEMREIAREWGRPDPVRADGERLQAYLDATLPMRTAGDEKRSEREGRHRDDDD